MLMYLVYAAATLVHCVTGSFPCLTHGVDDFAFFLSCGSCAGTVAQPNQLVRGARANSSTVRFCICSDGQPSVVQSSKPSCTISLPVCWEVLPLAILSDPCCALWHSLRCLRPLLLSLLVPELLELCHCAASGVRVGDRGITFACTKRQRLDTQVGRKTPADTGTVAHREVSRDEVKKAVQWHVAACRAVARLAARCSVSAVTTSRVCAGAVARSSLACVAAVVVSSLLVWSALETIRLPSPRNKGWASSAYRFSLSASVASRWPSGGLCCDVGRASGSQETKM